MALFIKQDENRSKLQERLASELQERAKKRALDPPPDGVEDSKYIEGTKRTTSLAWAWLAVAALAIGVFIYIIVIYAGK